MCERSATCRADSNPEAWASAACVAARRCSVSSFSADATTRERFGEILYNQADADADGKLTVGEFVAFYAAKFATMDDDAFTQVTAELLKAAEASPAAAPAAA